MTAIDVAAGLGRRGLTRGRRPPRVGLVLAAGILLLIILIAVAPGLFTDRSPTDTASVDALHGPSGAHWFGTDQLGRDVFTRVVDGAGRSLRLGVGATLLGVLAGAVLGLAAALGGRAADTVLMRLADVLLALPPLLLALLAMTVLGSGAWNLTLAVAISTVPGYARMVRAEALVVRRSGYVEAAVGLGLRRWLLVARHILPNTLGPLLVLATVGFGTTLIAASSLSFLGFGVGPPTPEWGLMLSEGRNYLSTAWWIGVFPGAAIAVTVIAVNVVGRHAQARYTRRTSR
ncbi:ABC-type dipeptide/oligopeptide/nickel transport system, permease component [Frankia torreyi]|uniref:ABC-type dipeptide/oligopeptide/nickel transport system, permease component n=1 Tax=Frankia torreyi TaxID=1856 RepID=A0A0D8B683_9ACTN|nr:MULTISPECIES: ABC transporter permease [Frankia]KJE19778.1 ABC-type dipeptide/oligopeptide/nickel transport system, permease component [Frankia torreyi]KQC35894.1 peptide ABC transporter permease [Frankia sp. ACN1ag]KQM03909.1 ABC-type dipeptide/oligopeptide/nickel transport system, permease component [Frankia sp. CpI1-P]